MKELSANQTRDMLLAVCDKIIDAEPLLTKVDSKIGDGDHGIGMSGGMKKAREALIDHGDFSSVNEVFKVQGMTMLNSMGGASGVIFGSMFLGGLKGMETGLTLNSDVFVRFMRGSLDSIKARGGAQVGDKTMVDAFEPAVLAMEGIHTDSLTELCQLAEDKAFEGMENTKGMVAHFGRAKSLMERSVGYQDAGATSVYLIFQAMREFLESI